MKKFFLLLLFFSASLFGADASVWDHVHRYKLKKDEFAHITISTVESKGADKSEFYFRWTLVVKDRVTLLVNDKGYPHQYVLYKKHALDSVEFSLLPDGANSLEDKTYLLLVLSDINQRNNEVDFDIFIKDQKKRVLVDFNVPNKQ